MASIAPPTTSDSAFPAISTPIKRANSTPVKSAWSKGSPGAVYVHSDYASPPPAASVARSASTVVENKNSKTPPTTTATAVEVKESKRGSAPGSGDRVIGGG